MSERTPKLDLYLPVLGDGEDNSQEWGDQVAENFRVLDDALMPGDLPAPPARASASVTTASLGAGASAAVTVTLARTAHVLRIATDYPAWVRIYSSAAARDADASRPSTSYPEPGKGVVADTITAAGALAVDQDPVPLFACRDASGGVAYLAITNLDTVARAITCTISHLPMEV